MGIGHCRNSSSLTGSIATSPGQITAPSRAEHRSDLESYSSLPTGNGHFRLSDPDPSKSKPIGI